MKIILITFLVLASTLAFAEDCKLRLSGQSHDSSGEPAGIISFKLHQDVESAGQCFAKAQSSLGEEYLIKDDGGDEDTLTIKRVRFAFSNGEVKLRGTVKK